MQLAVEEFTLRVQIVRLAGRVDAASAPTLKEAFRALTRDGKCNFVVDLREVDFIDSTGLGIFTSLLRAARACEGDVCLMLLPTSPVYAVIEMVRFNQVFALYDHPEAALRHFTCP